MTTVPSVPLSESIASLSADGNECAWTDFVERLRFAQLGVVAQGMPSHFTTYRVRASEVGLGKTRTPNGLMVLAAADPDVYRMRYPAQPFNATMHAVSMFRTALANPDCAGVLINSAASALSLPLSRDQIVEIVARIDRASRE